VVQASDLRDSDDLAELGSLGGAALRQFFVEERRAQPQVRFPLPPSSGSPKVVGG
jgi:hypothetical protein